MEAAARPLDPAEAAELERITAELAAVDARLEELGGYASALRRGAVEPAARRRGVRDAAIVAVLLYAGARVEECARLDLDDVAITARTGVVRLHGKGDEVRTVPIPKAGRDAISAYLRVRGNEAGPLWRGQRGQLTISGTTQVVLAIGKAAGLTGLRPHRLRHILSAL